MHRCSCQGLVDEKQGLFILGKCHYFNKLSTESEPQAKNLKSFSKNLVRILKKRNEPRTLDPSLRSG